MPLIDDSDDEIEEFMVTSENLSEWYVFLLNNHCINCNKKKYCVSICDARSATLFSLPQHFKDYLEGSSVTVDSHKKESQ